MIRSIYPNIWEKTIYGKDKGTSIAEMYNLLPVQEKVIEISNKNNKLEYKAVS